jgi:Ca-activated chloride channel family protein
MMKRVITLILLCLASGAMAQLSPPARLISTETGAEPITLQHLSIRSAISGGMAETTVTMVFFNPNPRQLEGNLQFSLAEGQQVSGFALDIDGQMRPAVPVAKERGRAVFEEIVRRGADPALLELTQGNNFKLRVYPIPAHGRRTVELRYGEMLHKRAQQWAYRLPSSFGASGKADVSITVNDLAAQPQAHELNFETANDGYHAHWEGKSLPAQGMEILMAAHDKASVYRQRVGESTWFVAEVPLPSSRTARPVPRVIGLLWDASGSGAKRAHEAELLELERYFSAVKNVEVRLTRLRDRPEARQVFKVVNGDWHSLRSALASTVYDGASALNDWPVQSDVNLYLLFSDGLSNYGSTRAPVLAPRQRLFTLNASPSADTARLTALAERAGGEFVQIDSAAPGAAAQTLLFQEGRIEHLSALGATDLEVDSHTVRDGMLRVAGRLLAPQATLNLTLSNSGHLRRLGVPIAANAPLHPSAATTWAHFRLRALEGEFDAHRSEIADIGRRFGIPTRETSLMVLDTIEDYLRFDIAPPTHLAQAYQRLKKERKSEQAQEKRDHFNEVVNRYAQRVTWWQTHFHARKAKRLEEVPVPVAESAPAAAVVMANDAERQRTTGDADKTMFGRDKADKGDTGDAYLARLENAPAKAASAPPSKMSPDMAGNASAQAADAPLSTPAVIGMTLKKWEPTAPYIERMQAAAPEHAYRVYLDQKPDYANSSAFFLDAADILFAKGQRDLALRVLSNLAEMDLENRAVLRILAYRLLQANAPQLAVPVFRQVLLIAAEEPQSLRDLGLALAAAGSRQEAIDKLYEVTQHPWDARFADIEMTSLAEMNALIAASPTPLDTRRIDRRLRAHLPLDVRVVLSWDADNTDIDLHVTDPDGEQCSYMNPHTAQGGAMSNDFTGGYGPEEFALRRAKPGKYTISAYFFGNHQQVLAGATTLQVRLSSHFGTPAQQDKFITLRLKEANDEILVGEFEVAR